MSLTRCIRSLVALLLDRPRLRLAIATSLAVLCSAGLAEAGPDHPVITEIFRDPPGNDGPVGRDPANLHQEFIEIYLPTLADLAPGLAKDSLDLAFVEIEGDSSSLELGRVSYRIDLPTFDLDPSNGLTGLPRPPSGLVVLGWVDYVGNPPTALAGTPSTRVALVDGGVTSTPGYTFVAVNGAQFGGTTNFPVPVAVSHFDVPTDAIVGKIEQGAAAYLLLDRDDPGYAPICAWNDPAPCNDLPDLPSGLVLGVSSLLDGFANNDDAKFRVDRQPYEVPTGDNIDLEFVLPFGGAFSNLVPQLDERGEGHQRVFVDWVKTSEDGVVGNEDPVVDALTAYRDVTNTGPFVPTPGVAPSTASAGRLSVADAVVQQFDVLAGTTAHTGLFAANTGGNRGMGLTTIPSASSNPALVSFFSDTSSAPAVGQAGIGPSVGAVVASSAPDGHVETITVAVSATATGVGDPPVVDPSASVAATYRVIDPVFGLTELLQPYQATAFVAVLGLPNEPGVANEIPGTSLGAWLTPRFGTTAFDSRGHGATLLDPLFDLSNPVLVDPMIGTLPDLPANFINLPGPPGRPDLVATVLGSAEVQAGTGTYDDSFNATQTRLQAKEFDIIPPTRTTNGGFVPTERVHYADSIGRVGSLSSGLRDVETTRDFELMMIETHLGPTGVLEDGETDDFGLIVRAADVAPGSPVVPGEFVFLSYTGGFEGADIDGLNVPPGNVMTSIVFVDLENLGTQLGVETIDRVIVVDGSGAREAEFIDIFSLPEPGLGVGVGVSALVLLGLRRRRPERAVIGVTGAAGTGVGVA
ncbi:MAG: hypothetical protein H6748_06140 [Spirochaetaceae bacterium]|nr:hypothetical protein [Spirochaetaceae bacterium]